ncbi:hypothetical protein Tco_0838609 [Tanacetum coccineum]|uniref:Uncharacterized protein n=1 Tax=Tanacetum coccineum TaxID=301880 RepID=A0ABQ5AR49_9ASTR
MQTDNTPSGNQLWKCYYAQSDHYRSYAQRLLKKLWSHTHNEKSIKSSLGFTNSLMKFNPKSKKLLTTFRKIKREAYLAEMLGEDETSKKILKPLMIVNLLRARIQKIIIDDDDDDLGFYAVHPNTTHTPVSQNIEPKDSLIMGDGHINTTPETETISVETLVSNPSESDDFSLGRKSLSCVVDDDDTDDDDD